MKRNCKHILSLALALCLLLALALPAAAAGQGFQTVYRSRNLLRVNGSLRDCDKFAIADYNYFKLRDLAALLDGTASQFDVDFDATRGCILIYTGQPYTHRSAGDLVMSSNETAKGRLSPQSLIVDGVERTGLSVYYIAPNEYDNGNNYFKLRDLQPLLGFVVDYDPITSAAVVNSSDYKAPTRLGLSADGGRDYLNRIIFLGDSTTYGIAAYYNVGFTSLCPPSQVWTPKSGTLALFNWTIAKIVYPATGEEILITEAVRRAKPEYLLITLGINGVSSMDRDWFIRDYTALVQAIQEASPSTKIILNSIYPVARSYAHQDQINNTKIIAANGWIEQIAGNTGCRFLYSFESVVGADGYLPESSQNGDGLHLRGEALTTVMQYIRTHMYQ